jgi:polar amino acid transport system substrate-binding protein
LAVTINGLAVAYVNEWPFSFREGSEAPRGFDIDIIMECSKRLRLPPPTFREISWEEIVPMLKSGSIDIAITGLAWSPERARAGIPSEPLYTVASAAFVSRGNPLKVHSLEDIASGSYPVGTIQGALETDVARSRLAAERVIAFEDEAQLWGALDNGEVGAALFAEVAGLYYLREHPDATFELAEPFSYPELPKTMYWFTISRVGLVDRFNERIRQMKQDGSLPAILVRFGYRARHMLPAGVKVR